MFKMTPIRKWILVLCAILAVLILASNDPIEEDFNSPPPEKVTTTTTEATLTEGELADALYDATMVSMGYVPHEEGREMAMAVCNAIPDFRNYKEAANALVAVLLANHNSNTDQSYYEEVGAILGVGINAYCPQHEAFLDHL